MREALAFFAREFSVTRPEALRGLSEVGGAEMLLDAALSLGYVAHRNDRYQLSELGRNALKATEPA